MARVGNTLVFSFDGTGKEPADAEGFRQDESISNILKLHVLLGGGIDPQPPRETPAGGRQTAFYYNGIGTRQGRRDPSRCWAGCTRPGAGW